MPAFTIDDLTTPLTRQEVEGKIYEVIALVGTNTTSWKPGAVARTMIVGFSVVGAGLSSLTAQVARSGFLELASGSWLTLKAWYDYKVARDEGTYAEGAVTLVNSGGGVYMLDVDDLTVANPDTGKQYSNTSAINLAALATLVVPIKARELGTASTSAPGEITEMITPLLGVTCANEAPVVGLDPESDPTLRARCSEKLGSLSPMGPWDAYTYAARNATRVDGSKVGVTRVRSTKDGYGNVTTYVATASGAVTGDVDDPGTDLGAINEAIQTLAAPLAVTAWVESATPVTLDITYKLAMYNTSGRSEPEIVEAIEENLLAFFSGQPIGGNKTSSGLGKIYVDAIESSIASTYPQIFHVEVTLPAADIELAVNAVPVLGVVTPALIQQVSPGEGAVL